MTTVTVSLPLLQGFRLDTVAGRVKAVTLLRIAQSGRSRVQSQVAAGAKYGEFSSREKSHGCLLTRKALNQNSIMPARL